MNPFLLFIRLALTFYRKAAFVININSLQGSLGLNYQLPILGEIPNCVPLTQLGYKLGCKLSV